MERGRKNRQEEGGPPTISHLSGLVHAGSVINRSGTGGSFRAEGASFEQVNDFFFGKKWADQLSGTRFFLPSG